MLSATGSGVQSSSDSTREGSSALMMGCVQVQSGNKLPVTKHTAAMRKIKRECSIALQRKNRGEITHEEFMRIAKDCVERAKARQEAAKLMCDRVDSGEAVSVEEFERDCGYSEEDWQKLRPRIMNEADALAENVRRNRSRVFQKRSLRGR
ncbi:hypothetical protein EVG20_g6477 [Dentipellis fragilis]|uniref:Uncharacterized protein n=1 Tax=Dentipellis fragilis TaxID=205917 RepID=A0A4Y9YKG3_9AGAM|nr:hypothetical protein EVG20_g6477 [Dentipellis fragilis]